MLKCNTIMDESKCNNQPIMSIMLGGIDDDHSKEIKGALLLAKEELEGRQLFC